MYLNNPFLPIDSVIGNPRPTIIVGDYRISLQAGEYYYCSPRENLKYLFDYETIEMAIFFENSFINPPEWVLSKEKFDQLSWDEVGAYIPLGIAMEILFNIANRAESENKLSAETKAILQLAKNYDKLKVLF